mgnify:CR=1 FL=1
MAIYDYTSGGFPASPAADDTLAMKGTTYKYNGSAWEVQTGGTTSFTYTATSGQTAFTGADTGSKTLAYTAASLHVFLNGVLLDAADYTATDGTTVTLGTGASTGDTLQVVAYGVLVSAGGGGGGWTEISTDTISSDTASLEFTGISTDFNFLRLYMTDIEYSPAAPDYIALGVSSSDSFSTQLTWRASHVCNMTSNTAVEMSYGTNDDKVTLFDSNMDNINHPHYALTFVLDLYDIQDKPYMSLEAIVPDDGARWSTAKAHGCSDRIQSIRLYNALGTSRYFTDGTYKLYGMK